MDMNLYRPKRRVRSYMPSAKSLANLIPYKPGQNGHGRVYPLKERLQHALFKPLKAPKVGAPVAEHIVYSTLKGAVDLVPVAFRETWDRVEGKVPDKHAVLGKVLFEVVHVDKRRDYLEEFSGGAEGSNDSQNATE